MLIAITGATGFIGQRLARALIKAGHELRALTRQPSAALPPEIEQISGDLADTDALGHLVRGVDAVMHLAGAVRGAKANDFDRPNVQGTRNLLLQMQHEAPACPLLFISSLAAREPALSHYAASTRQAEHRLVELANERPWLILRPPAVYGPGDREMLPVFRFMARTGIAPCAGKHSDRLSLIFVDDLVAVAMAVFDRLMPGPNQLGVRRTDVSVTQDDLLEVHDGIRTPGGFRDNVRTAVTYLEAWFSGRGAVPIDNIVEDASLAEISRAQVWQQIRFRASLADGRRATPQFLDQCLKEEMAKVQEEIGEDAFRAGRFPEAIALFRSLSVAETLEPFMTLAAYRMIA